MRVLGLLAVWSVACAGQVLLSQRLDVGALPDQAQQVLVPTVPVAMIHGLLRHRAAADLQWVRTANYAGDSKHDATGHRQLPDLVNLVTALDPDHESAYQLGGLLLANQMEQGRAAVETLQRGGARFPNRWQFGFYAGAVALGTLGDVGLATQEWKKCMTIPGAPGFLGSLVARLTGKASRCVVAVIAVQELMRGSPPAAQGALSERMSLLRLECALLELEDAVEHYTQAQGKPPASLEELVTAGHLAAIPSDPWGVGFGLDAQGGVFSKTGKPRVRLLEGHGP